MQFSTIGGVIPAGQPILEIVPLDDELVIEAQVPLNDIDNVTVGQDVRTTIAALNQRTTPELLGNSHIRWCRCRQRSNNWAAVFPRANRL